MILERVICRSNKLFCLSLFTPLPFLLQVSNNSYYHSLSNVLSNRIFSPSEHYNFGLADIKMLGQVYLSRVFQSDYFLLFALLLISLIIFVGIKLIIIDYNRRQEIKQKQIESRCLELEKINMNMMEEIKRRKEAEVLLMEDIERLKETNITKDKFFSIISHDLKSPFQGLLGFTQMLSEDFDSLDEANKKKLISEIRSSALHIYNLLLNVLEWARLQSNRAEFTPEKINLSLEVEEVIKLLSVNAISKNISLHNEINKECYLLADRHMLRSILHNLLSNAIKFTEQGGYVKFRASLAGNFYVISVIDNGVGIKPEDVGKIFSIGIQYTTAGTAKEKGTGLGLSLCREMIEKHGGSIWVESKVGVGSSFRFTLPKYKSRTQDSSIPIDLFTNNSK